VAAIACRQATLEDAAAIHDLLLALAPEIPLFVETPEREEALYALVRSCARSGESWVAADAAGRIVGFVLVEPSQLGRHYGEHELLELRYAGVAADRRGEGIFGRLVAPVLARMVPIAASVSPHNRAGMAQRLAQLGFRPVAAAGGEQRLRREPGKRG
jgi:N-acetylglutamate synthase-like GNAT family acetyltransferase